MAGNTSLNGDCGPEYQALYDCWATAELTCSNFNVASAASCADLSAVAAVPDLATGSTVRSGRGGAGRGRVHGFVEFLQAARSLHTICL